LAARQLLLGALLAVHIFVGLLLLGPVALKLATTGYRFARYYGGAREYVALGPPELLMRVLVAPVLVLSTLTLFGTGVALVVSPHRGAVLGLHKASVLWFGACSLHVLAYGLRAPSGGSSRPRPPASSCGSPASPLRSPPASSWPSRRTRWRRRGCTARSAGATEGLRVSRKPARRAPRCPGLRRGR
jgi:hypothetical protein